MGTDEAIRDLAEGQHGVVSRVQLRDVGIGSEALLHRIRKGVLEPMSPKVLRLVGTSPTEDQLAAAAVLDAPGAAYLSHGSALAWWRVPGFALAQPVQVVIPWQGVRRRTRLAEVHFHRGLPTAHLLEKGGLRVVSPSLAVFLVAGVDHPWKAERALDNVLSLRLGTLKGFHRLLAELAERGRNGVTMMRALLAERPPDYVPPQSGLEARVEQLAKEVGVRLRRQVNVGDDEWIARVDFEIEDTVDVIEVLSDRYHGSLLDRQADTVRFDRIGATGRRVLTLWDSDIWTRAEWVRQEILSFWRAGIGL